MVIASASRASRRRIADAVLLTAAVVVCGLFIAVWAQFYLAGGGANIGIDYVLYRDAAVRWLSGDGFYLPYQLAGPYVISHGDVLYPPPILVLLVPFTVLPAALWWVAPIGVIAAVVARHRPSPLAWLLIALCLLYPITGVKIWHGNPGLWFTAAIALGTLFAWPSALVFLKPTLFPFALVGIRRRAWWVGLGGLVLVSLVFLPMWPDFVLAVRNGQAEGGLFYSVNEYPLELIPVIAWLGSTRRPSAFRLARGATPDGMSLGR